MHYPLRSLAYRELWAQRSPGTCTCWLHRGLRESNISLSALCRHCWWAECSSSAAGHPAAWCGLCNSRAPLLCVIWRLQGGRVEGRAGQSTRCRECRGMAWCPMDTWRCTGWPRRSLSWLRCPEGPKRSTGHWHLGVDQRHNVLNTIPSSVMRRADYIVIICPPLNKTLGITVDDQQQW